MAVSGGPMLKVRHPDFSLFVKGGSFIFGRKLLARLFLDRLELLKAHALYHAVCLREKGLRRFIVVSARVGAGDVIQVLEHVQKIINKYLLSNLKYWRRWTFNYSNITRPYHKTYA